MNRNVNVFIAVVLCMGLCGGLIWLHTANDGKLGWNIQDLYGDSGSSSGVAYTNATFSGSADGGSLSMPVMSSRSLRRSATSHVGVSSQPIANSLSPLTSSPLTSSPTAGGAMYATSSQTYKSFGGGMYAGASQVSNSRSANSPSPIANSSAGLSVSPISYTSLRGTSNNPQEVLSNADIAAVMAASASMPNSSMFGTYSAFSNASSISSYNPIPSGNTYRGIGGKFNVPGLGDTNFENWLLSFGWGHADEKHYTEPNENDLRALYVALTGDSSFQNKDQWYAFLAWFKAQQSGGNKWYLPLSDAIPFVLLLALAYTLYIYIINRKKLQTK